MSYLRYMDLLAYSGVQHILCGSFSFVCLRLVCLMLVVSLVCPFLIAHSVFSSVYFKLTIYDCIKKNFHGFMDNIL
jgi:hypothetical protein